MEAIKLDQRIQLKFEDLKKATGFQLRGDRKDFVITMPKNIDNESEDDYESEKMESVQSDDYAYEILMSQ